MRPWSAPPSPFSPRMSSTTSTTTTPTPAPPAPARATRVHRTRPLTEQIQVIRELWLLREQARVQAAERRFLAELERLLSGRAGTEDAPRPPAPQPRRMHDGGGGGASRPPPPPPPPPVVPGDAFTAGMYVQDGVVFESHPPPRRESAPVRESRGAVEREVEQLRSRQQVTNLSPEFRAVLEGNEPTLPRDYRTLSRSRSFGELSDQRAVSSALESEFRHHLEHLLGRRSIRASAGPTGETEYMETVSPAAYTGTTSGQTTPSRGLEVAVRRLSEEVAVLKNVVSASFDLQLDVQRAVRQEVAAAMRGGGGVQDSCVSMCTEMETEVREGGAGTGAAAAAEAGTGVTAGVAGFEKRARAVAAGVCTVCLERRVDALLYACGHMCTCGLCGRQLLAAGQACPICRAPVRDVVRAFMVTE